MPGPDAVIYYVLIVYFVFFFFPEQMQSFLISSGFTAKKHIFILSLGTNQFSEPGTD